MTWWQDLKARWGQRKPPRIPVTIDGQELEVTEWVRASAAQNMRLDPECKARVVALLEQRYPGRGEEVARRNYPEAFED